MKTLALNLVVLCVGIGGPALAARQHFSAPAPADTMAEPQLDSPAKSAGFIIKPSVSVPVEVASSRAPATPAKKAVTAPAREQNRASWVRTQGVAQPFARRRALDADVRLPPSEARDPSYLASVANENRTQAVQHELTRMERALSSETGPRAAVLLQDVQRLSRTLAATAGVPSDADLTQLERRTADLRRRADDLASR